MRMTDLWSRIRKITQRPSHATVDTRLRPTRDGLEISPMMGTPSSVFLRWAEVTRAVAFKRDQYVVDRICLAFELSHSTLEVNEDMLGWEQLVNELPDRLAGARAYDDWFGKVAFPAFEANETIVFERSG
jgi:hypothetical protein